MNAQVEFTVPKKAKITLAHGLVRPDNTDVLLNGSKVLYICKEYNFPNSIILRAFWIKGENNPDVWTVRYFYMRKYTDGTQAEMELGEEGVAESERVHTQLTSAELEAKLAQMSSL